MEKCYKCGSIEGEKETELRPYGPNRELICYDCAFETEEQSLITEKSFCDNMIKSSPKEAYSLLTDFGRTDFFW